MASAMNVQKMLEYCTIPVDELENHPDARAKIKIFEDKADVAKYTAQLMIDEIEKNNAEGKPTRWVLPDGPVAQYDYFTKYVNEHRISLKNLHVFQMDEYLDFNCRPLPMEEGSQSLTYDFYKHFYNRIDEELNVPLEQRHRPLHENLDEMDDAIEKLGGLDSVFGGLGFRGLTAWCEFEQSPWITITEEDYINMKTRIYPVNDDTIIAYAMRSHGSLTHIIPPLAMSIGMKSMLKTKRMVYISTTGSWKRTAVRVLLFNEPTVEYPATLFTKYVPEVMIVCDKNTALPPIEESYYEYVKKNNRL